MNNNKLNIVDANDTRYFPKEAVPLSEEEEAKYKSPDTGGYGEIVASLNVPFDLIDVMRHQNQNRAKDIDPEHVRSVMRDIKNRGLQNPPYVMWDPISEKFIPLSYHRCTGMVEDNWNTIPVRVVEFESQSEKQDFLDHQNNHPPAKNADLDDAVLSIQSRNSLGVFNGMNEKQIKAKVYAILDKFFSGLHTSKKSQVVQRVFEFDKSRFKGWTSKGRKSQIGYLKSEGCTDVYFSTDNSNIQKLLGLTISSLSNNKSKTISDNTSWKRKDIHAVVSIHIKSSDSNIDSKRKTVLHQMSEMNRYGIHPKLAILKSITFLPQVLEPVEKMETENITYAWDEEEKQFLLD